jgi:hypothetical protein
MICVATVKSIDHGCWSHPHPRPIIASIHAPITLLSKFLNNLLAPVYLKVARETTFVNDIDLVRKLEAHIKNGYFNTTTIFYYS